MASLLTHALVGAAAGRSLGPRTPWLWATAAFLSVAPDLDVIGFAFGVRYGDPWGHRGMTHSLAAAVVVGLVAALALRGRIAVPWPQIAALFAAVTASHGVFDAMTDGGLGVAFFAPFDDGRYFLPLRPVRVSPLSLGEALSGRGLAVLATEFVWIWLPVGLLLAGLALIRRRASGTPPP